MNLIHKAIENLKDEKDLESLDKMELTYLLTQTDGLIQALDGLSLELKNKADIIMDKIEKLKNN